MTDTSSLKVLACIYDLRVGGAETSLLGEFRRMSAHGVRAEVLCLGQDRTLEPEFVDSGITVTFVPSGSWRSRFAFLWRLLQKKDIDVVHTMLFWPDVVVRPLARIRGIRVVSSLTNEYYGSEHRKNSHYGTLGVLFAQVADAISSQFACGYHAISARSAHIMARRLGLRSSKITVIYRGRDFEALGQRSEDRRRRVRSREECDATPLFLCVGRQDYQKAHEVAVRAFSSIADEFPESQLWLAGRSGGNSEVIARAVSESPAASRIKILGERDDIGDLLCAADCFIMPSRFEGLAGSVIEAMVLELPMLLTDIEVFREVADNKALYFQRDNARELAEMMRQVAMGRYPNGWTQSLGMRTRELFNIEHVAAELADFYRKHAVSR